MLSRTGLWSNSVVSSWMSRPLGSVSGALCRRGGSLVATTSMILLWVNVWDGAICFFDGVSGVLQESVRRCSSRAEAVPRTYGPWPGGL